MRYLVYTPKFGLWYPKGFTFDLIGYSDADYVGCKIDRMSTSGIRQFLGISLVFWASKKQNLVALSIAKAEYHFLRDHQQKGDIEIAYVSTHNQLADIFTKPLDEKTFSKLRNELNILDSRNFD
jgi:hypothetical protein